MKKTPAAARARRLRGPRSARAAEKKPLPKDLPPFGEDKPLPVPQIAQSKLPNGLTVWLVKRGGYPQGRGQAGGARRIGGRPEGRPGHLRAARRHLEGRDHHPHVAADRRGAADGRRARSSANAAADAIYVTASGLGSGAPKMLEIVADVARNAIFPASRGRAGQGQRAPGAQGPGGDARVPWPRRPWPGRCTATTRTTSWRPPRRRCRRRRPTQLKKEHARRFRPEGALLVVVGDLDAAAVTAAVTRAFGAWKGIGRRAGRDSRSPGGRSAAPHRRQSPRLGAVADPHGPPGGDEHRPRVLPAARGQHDLRRLLRQPPDREHPRGQGLHLFAGRRRPGPRARAGC